MHQIMMTKVISQVYRQSKTYEWKIEPTAIVRIDCVHTTQASDQVASGYLISNELNQVARTVNSQTDANNGYLVVE
jgi:hypothetical protein